MSEVLIHFEKCIIPVNVRGSTVAIWAVESFGGREPGSQQIDR